jgi:catechol 2,3-dioxygenase-like lactoylglutathione lyase family enzyme
MTAGLRESLFEPVAETLGSITAFNPRRMNPHRGALHHLTIVASDLKRSAAFYGPVFHYLGYERTDYEHGGKWAFEDWYLWLEGTPHQIRIRQSAHRAKVARRGRKSDSHPGRIAFCAESREDLDQLYEGILLPLERQGLCVIERPPSPLPDCVDGTLATVFLDPDGLKLEFVFSPRYPAKKEARDARMHTP